MLNSLAIKLLSTLLVFALWSATLTLVFHQTMLNSHYVEGRLDSIHGYDRLSGALVDEIAHTPDLAANPEVAAKIKPILTPQVLKVKLNSALDQMETYYLHGGPQPVIDLSDLAVQAQAAGIPVPQGSSLNQKIVLGGNKQGQDQTQAKTKNAGSTFDRARTTSVIASLLLAAALVGLSLKQRRYTALPTVLITVGILVALLAAFLSIAPSVIDRFIKIGANSNAFAILGHDLASSIARDLGTRFGIIAAIYLVLGISTRALASRLQPKPQVQQSFVKAK
jgi:hypothetical protein